MQNLADIIELFDLESYVNQTFPKTMSVGGVSDEIRVNCFSPNGCNGSDTKFHLYINCHKKRWICHRCGYGDSGQQPRTSSLVQFIADAEDLPVPIVIRRLYSITVPTPVADFEDQLLEKFQQVRKEPVPTPEIRLPKEFVKLSTVTPNSISSKAFLSYTNLRGFDAGDIVKFDVRFCPTDFYDSNRINWRGKIIFPIYDQDGVCRSAVGRSLVRKIVTNFPGTFISQFLWPNTRDNMEEIVLAEGVFDAHAVWKLTGLSSFATFGKHISENQQNLLYKMGVKRIILSWDKDARDQIERAVKKLSSSFRVELFPFRSSFWSTHDLGEAYELPRDSLLNEFRETVKPGSIEMAVWRLR
jgi:hypothetical protein